MSTLRANTVANAAGTGPVTLTSQWAGRCYWFYDQVTPGINSSGNISSVTDNSAGNHTANFTNNFATAADKSFPACAGMDAATSNGRRATSKDDDAPTTSDKDFVTHNNSEALIDSYSHAIGIGDLA